MPTPHINANKGDFAKTVLMPGDPLRSKFIAENFLTDARLINNVRGVQGYTGYYEGKRVSVMASGMGMPSIGIYSYELFNFFDVESIIRVGSAGAMQEDVHLRDIVLGMGACTNSSFANQYNLGGTYAPTASYELIEKAVSELKAMKIPYHVGNILSSDNFYNADEEASGRWARMGVLAVEMEAAALYTTAAACRKRALAICTISDSLVTGESLDSDARQNTFTDMMRVALNIAE